MTKTDLIEKLYEENYCTKKDAEALVNAVFDAIRDAMVAGDKVTILSLVLSKCGNAVQRNARIPVPVNRFRFRLPRLRSSRQART